VTREALAELAAALVRGELPGELLAQLADLGEGLAGRLGELAGRVRESADPRAVALAAAELLRLLGVRRPRAARRVRPGAAS
jgi:hypothetical protein